MRKSTSCTFGILLIIACGVKPTLFAQTQSTESGVVQPGVRDAVFEKRNVPIALFQAIARDMESRKFRLTWRYGAAGADTQGTVLYDRGSKSVKYWLRDITEFGVLTKISLYHNVSDEIISSLGKGLKEDINDYNPPQGNYYLDRLLKHGCKKTDLQDSYVKWPKR